MSLEQIKNIKAFENLTDSELDQVNTLIIWSNYPKNYSILSHHETSSDVYFIASGIVKSTIFSYSGKEIAYQNLGCGEMFGEISTIDNLDRTTNVIAIDDCLIGKMSSLNFWKVIENHPSVTRAVLLRLTGMV